MPAGRPTTLTPDIILRVCLIIHEGNYRDTAARAAGVAPRTFNRWLSRGRLESDDAGSLYGQMWQMVHEAETVAELKAVRAWTGAFGTDWKAAKEYLAIKWPNKWSSNRGKVREIERRLKELEAMLADRAATTGEATLPKRGAGQDDGGGDVRPLSPSAD